MLSVIYAECRMVSNANKPFMLSVFMVNVVMLMLSVIMLNVVIMSVIMLGKFNTPFLSIFSLPTSTFAIYEFFFCWKCLIGNPSEQKFQLFLSWFKNSYIERYFKLKVWQIMMLIYICLHFARGGEHFFSLALSLHYMASPIYIPGNT